MKLQLPKIYPITDARISGLPAHDQVERLIEGGATLIQLREKTASSRDFYDAAVRSLEIARSHGVRLIINDRVDIALATRADGVHLGQDDLPVEQARRILGSDAIIGISTHTPYQAKAAIALPVNYIAIGPIFSTSTKTNPDAVVGLEGLERVRSEIGDFPLVAIGGINRENVGSVFSAGADSASIVSDIMSDAGQIAEKMQHFLQL